MSDEFWIWVLFVYIYVSSALAMGIMAGWFDKWFKKLLSKNKQEGKDV